MLESDLALQWCSEASWEAAVVNHVGGQLQEKAFRANMNQIQPTFLLSVFVPAPSPHPHPLPPRVSTCELLHGLQPDSDALMGEQRGGGQGAGHALHHADVLHALRHGERGHSVVSLEGTVAVYAATFRTGGDKGC